MRPAPKRTEQEQAQLKAFGKAVRVAREARGHSQEGFAVACGLDRSYMGGVERGERNVAVLNIWKIAEALELDPGELFR